jgi:hypothetical protein
MHASPPAERYHALDSLRAAAMLLGITLHAAVAYMNFAPLPWPMHPTRHLLFDVHNLYVHCFRMQLFFLLAGFFAALVVEKRGPGAFVKQRLQRIGIPFLLGMLTLVPLTLGIFFLTVPNPSAGQQQFSIRDLFFSNTIHLWFLYYLLQFSLLAALFVWCAKRSPLVGRFTASAGVVFGKLSRRPEGLLLLALPTFVVFLFSPAWGDIGLATGWVPEWRVFLYYLVFFVAGWCVYHRRNLVNRLPDQVWYFGGWVLLLGLALPPLMLMEHRAGVPNHQWLRIAAIAVYNLLTWSFIFLFLALFQRWCNRPSRGWRYLSEASYWIYLVHLPVVLCFIVLFARLKVNAFVAFAGVCGCSMLVLAASYHFCVRGRWIGRLLNGPAKNDLNTTSASFVPSANGRTVPVAVEGTEQD